MNKFYFIVPIVLLAAFGFFYRGARQDIYDHIAKVKAENQAKLDEEAARKKKIEEIAQKEAAEKQRQRDAEEEAKRLKKEKDYNDNMAKLENDTKGYLSDSDKYTKEINQLEIALLNARSQRDKTASEAFELSKKVEEAKVSRRSAELEIQRLIEMVRVKSSASPLAIIPPAPPAKK